MYEPSPAICTLGMHASEAKVDCRERDASTQVARAFEWSMICFLVQRATESKGLFSVSYVISADCLPFGSRQVTLDSFWLPCVLIVKLFT